MNITVLLFSIFVIVNCIISGATNDTINNRSILNGGVRARMRLHSSENLAPSIYRGLTNIHLSSNYNSQTNSNKNIDLSTAVPIADSTSGGNAVGSSASNSSLSTGILVNGHTIPITDKSMMSPGNRHASDARTFTGRSVVKEQSSASANSSEGRAYTWSNYSNADQFAAMVRSDSRGPPRSEQSSSMVPAQQQICADVRGIPRQDYQSMLPNMDGSGAAQTDANTSSSHVDSCGSAAGALRIEQSTVADSPDGRAMTRSEQSTSILADDLCGARQLDQPMNIRRTSLTSEDQRAMRQQLEQSASIRVAEDGRGMKQQTEQSSANVRVSEDLRAMRQQSHQEQSSASVRPQEDVRAPRSAEQSMNAAAPFLDLRGGSSRGVSQQNASVPLTDNRAVVFRSEQSAMIPLTDGRTIPIVEHMSSAALLDSRSSIVPRISQTATSQSSQSIAVSMPGQSVTQPGSSVVLAEDINHSEEPLPPGWEMRYDLYGRR